MTADELLYQRQLELELEMQGLGSTRFWSAIQKARQKGQESTTPYGLAMLRSAIDPLSAAITAFLCPSGDKRNRIHGRHVAAKYLLCINPDVAAFICLKILLDSITFRRTLTQACLAIGAAIEDEARFRQFSDHKKNLWRVVTKDLDSRSRHAGHRRRTLIHTMNKAGVPFTEWPKHTKLHIGLKLVDLAVSATQLVRVTNLAVRRHETRTVIEPTQKTLDWMNEKTSRCEVLSPMYLPTIIRPRPWTTPYSGGYHSRVQRLCLVKTSNKNYLEELHGLRKEMPLVYQAINAVQATGWMIHPTILQVMRSAWDSGRCLGGLPSREDQLLPPKPADIALNKTARTVWKRAARHVHTANIKLRSKRIQQVKILWLAEKFQHERALYFPMQLDFRGRMYAVPSFLNPQGNDAAKALLLFKDGKPLGARGRIWLQIHGANCYGLDKLSFEARLSWVDDNRREILQAAHDPLRGGFWTTADKPWQFLAFCFEFSQAEQVGDSFISHLPIIVDGTCNGLQNFSAMLRDQVGGHATNLVPASEPQDIYQLVANKSMERVVRDAAGTLPVPTPHIKWAALWREYGFDRKATKRPVMVMPYGGTLFSARQYVQDYVQERSATGDRPPWSDEESYAACGYLAQVIWTSIRDVVIAARAAMDWLQHASSLAAQEQLPLTWKTPAGFFVFQRYPNIELRRVRSMISGSVIKLTLHQDVESTIDRRRQAQGVSPNFVHSMDASSLMLSVDAALAQGITSYAMVHDAYGSLAADMDALNLALRRAFVRQYQTDVLNEFRDCLLDVLSPERATQLLPIPPKGQLDLGIVLRSPYFFA